MSTSWEAGLLKPRRENVSNMFVSYGNNKIIPFTQMRGHEPLQFPTTERMIAVKPRHRLWISACLNRWNKCLKQWATSTGSDCCQFHSPVWQQSSWRNIQRNNLLILIYRLQKNHTVTLQEKTIFYLKWIMWLEECHISSSLPLAFKSLLIKL